MFDPNLLRGQGSKDAATRRVAAWARTALPQSIRSALQVNPAYCQITVREVVCGDPTCSPFDTIIIYVFLDSLKRVVATLRKELKAITEADVRDVVASHAAELLSTRGSDKGDVLPKDAEPFRPTAVNLAARVGPMLAAAAFFISMFAQRRHMARYAGLLCVAGGMSLIGCACVSVWGQHFPARRQGESHLRSGHKAALKRSKFAPDTGLRIPRGCPCCEFSRDLP